MSAGKPVSKASNPASVSKLLDALDAAITAIGEPEAEIFGHHWTPDEGLVSNDKPLKYKAIGHFGHFGHRKRDFLVSEHAQKRVFPRFFSYGRARVASSYIFGVQSVQSVQSRAQQGLNVGHLSDPSVQWCPKNVSPITKELEFDNPEHVSPVSSKVDSEGASSDFNDLKNFLPASLKAAFEERAAIAEVDGGLDREAAERLAWDEVNAGPIGDTLQAWRAWMNFRLPRWKRRGLSLDDAKRSMWSEAEGVWRLRHGAPPDPDRCAGCGEWMLDGPGMPFENGAVVHFGNPDRLDCLVIYGEAWRAAASAGLVALGLRKPE